MATVAELVEVKLDTDAGVDSFSMLSVLTNAKRKTSLRKYTVHHSINGSFAISQGDWKLALCPDSGGWSEPRPGKDDVSSLLPVQLYNLAADIGETNNLASAHPKKVARLTALLQDYVDRGRSTPGSRQINDRAIDILAHTGKAVKKIKATPRRNPASPKA